MIKFVIIFCILFTSNVFADEAYSSDTAKDIQAIYWLNKNQDGAIVYAKHYGFVQLKNLIDSAILTSEQVQNSKFNLEVAEQLLIMLPATKKWLVVYITEEQLFYDGQTYLVNPESLKEMLQINNYRKDKGDSISLQLLNRAKKSFGLP